MGAGVVGVGLETTGLPLMCTDFGVIPGAFLTGLGMGIST